MQSEYDVRVLSILGGAFESRARAFAPTIVLRPGATAWSARSPLSKGITLAAGTAKAALMLRRWRPDVIYLNSVSSLSITRQVRLPKRPVILHVHESPVLMSCLLSTQGSRRELVSMPSTYIAVSELVRDCLVHEYSVNPDRIRVIPSFVRADRIRGTQSATSAAPARFTVGGVGTPSWYKGGDLWLLTAAELKRRLGAKRLRFVWVGARDDDESRKFAAMASKLSLADAVEIVPETPQALDLVQGFDLLAVTSWEDSSPLVALEAMGLGKPVVCFAAGGGTPLLVDGTGIVVSEFSPAAMAEAIVDLIEDPARLAELGALARQRVLNNFTAEQWVPAIEAEIRRFI
jgi:glycosyltransferase involved in cell wall biosynthesis